MRIKKYRYFVCDFETTVYENQEKTEVWASASVEMFTDDVIILHSIADQFNYFKELNCNIVAYYHNLKFDGAFWLSYLLEDLKLEQAYEKTGESINSVKWVHDKYMKNNTFKYSISDKGMWYTFVCLLYTSDAADE